MIAFLVYRGSAGNNNTHELDVSDWLIDGGKRMKATNAMRKTDAPHTAGKRLKLSPKRPRV